MKSKKRIFLGLTVITMLILGLIFIYVGRIIISGEKLTVTTVIAALFAILVLTVLVMYSLGFLGIIITIIRSKRYPVLDRISQTTLSSFYPFVINIGKLFKIAQDNIQRSFVEVNNHLVRARTKDTLTKNTRKILMLLPHCLQRSDCPHRITIDINNCKKCGRCSIGDLRELAEDYNIPLTVATGGTLARQAVKEANPSAILAVACERDLTSGILDTNPMPVLGVVNKRPNGPCFDTEVDLEEVKNGIEFLMKGGDPECISSR